MLDIQNGCYRKKILGIKNVKNDTLNKRFIDGRSSDGC